MEAAYRALSTFSGEVTVWTGEPAAGVRASILIRRPDRAGIEVTGPAGVTRVVADGTAVRLLAPGAASPASENPGDGGAVAAALRKAGLLETRIGRLLTGQEPLRTGEKLQALRPGGAGLRGGVPVEKVVAVVSTPRGEQTITLALGKKDHLLRQVVVTSGAGSFSEVRDGDERAGGHRRARRRLRHSPARRAAGGAGSGCPGSDPVPARHSTASRRARFSRGACRWSRRGLFRPPSATTSDR